MGEVIFELKHISGEDADETALSDVALKVKSGEMHVVLGMDYMELKCMLHLLCGNFTLKKGRALINHELVSMKELGTHFQYIASENVIYNDMSVFDNIYLMQSQLFSFFRRKALKAELRKIMEDIQAPLDLDKHCSQLTRQEKRILLYYRVIVSRPQLVVVFDSNEELNIDFDDQFKRLLGYIKNQGMGIIYLTSSTEKSLFFADKISLLRDGKLMGTIEGSDARRNPRHILRLFREWNMYTEDSMQQLSIEENWLETINIMTSRAELSAVIRYIAKNIVSSARAEECVIYVATQNFNQMLVVSDKDEPETLIHLDVLKQFSEGEERVFYKDGEGMQQIFHNTQELEQIYLKCSHCKAEATVIIQLCLNEKREFNEWEKEYIRVSGGEIYHTIAHSRLLENSDMLREVHHRIKNNLQLIISLLEMQKYSDVPLTADMLDSTIKRVKSIALVHDMFAYKSNGAECGLVSLKNLIHNLAQIYETGRMCVIVDMTDILLPYDTATSMLMVINEILNNAWKYAFDGKEDGGEVRISVKEDPQMMYFTIADNGVGMPEETAGQQSGGLGYLIVDSIVKNDLDGEIRMNPVKGENIGVSVQIDIPKKSFLPKM